MCEGLRLKRVFHVVIAMLGAVAMLGGMFASLPASADEVNSAQHESTATDTPVDGADAAAQVEEAPSEAPGSEQSEKTEKSENPKSDKSDVVSRPVGSKAQLASQPVTAQADDTCAGLMTLASGSGWCVADEPNVGPVAHVTGKAGLIANTYVDGPNGYMKRIVKIYIDEPIVLSSNDRFGLGYMDVLQSVSGLEKVDVSQLKSLREAFARDGQLKTLSGIEQWKTGNVTDMYAMFDDAKHLGSLDLSDWDTSSVTNMSCMFLGVEMSGSLNLSGWNTSHVNDMSNMFGYATFSGSLNLHGWNINPGVNMHRLFVYGHIDGDLNLGGWDLRSIVQPSQVEEMFLGLNDPASLTLGPRTYLDSVRPNSPNRPNGGDVYWLPTDSGDLSVTQRDTLFDSTVPRIGDVTYYRTDSAWRLVIQYENVRIHSTITDASVRAMGLTRNVLTKKGGNVGGDSAPSFTLTAPSGWQFSGCPSSSSVVFTECTAESLVGKVKSDGRVVVNMLNNAEDSATPTGGSSSNPKPSGPVGVPDGPGVSGETRPSDSLPLLSILAASPLRQNARGSVSSLSAGRRATGSSQGTNSSSSVLKVSPYARGHASGKVRSKANSSHQMCVAWIDSSHDGLISDYGTNSQVTPGQVVQVADGCSNQKSAVVGGLRGARYFTWLPYFLSGAVIGGFALEAIYLGFRRRSTDGDIDEGYGRVSGDDGRGRSAGMYGARHSGGSSELSSDVNEVAMPKVARHAKSNLDAALS